MLTPSRDLGSTCLQLRHFGRLQHPDVRRKATFWAIALAAARVHQKLPPWRHSRYQYQCWPWRRLGRGSRAPCLPEAMPQRPPDGRCTRCRRRGGPAVGALWMTPSGWRDGAERLRASEVIGVTAPNSIPAKARGHADISGSAPARVKSKEPHTVSMDERSREAAGREFQVLWDAVA